MKRVKVIARKSLPARFPAGWAALLIIFGETLESKMYWIFISILFVLIYSVILFRQFTEEQVELKDFEEDDSSSPTSNVCDQICSQYDSENPYIK